MNRFILVVVACMFLFVGVAQSADYIQASATADQCPGMNPTVVLIDSIDGSNGVTLVNNEFIVSDDGLYLVVAAPQVGLAKGGKPGCLNLWLRLNGSDVLNSNVQLCQSGMDKDVIVGQGLLELREDDALQVMMSGTGLCLEAIQPLGEPLIPAIIFSMVRQ